MYVFTCVLSYDFSETELGDIAKGLLPKLVLQTIEMAWIQGIATGAEVLENTTLYGVVVQPCKYQHVCITFLERNILINQ